MDTGNLFIITGSNFRLNFKRTLFPSIILLLVISLIYGTSNLDSAKSANCLERMVALIGLPMFVPLLNPEQDLLVFDEVMEFLNQYPCFEHLRIKDEPMVLLPGLEIYPNRHKIYRDRREINLTAKEYELLKKWYNGYIFGNSNVYNPWSVIKFMYDQYGDENALPRAYWVNTSSNRIVRELIDRADRDVKKEIEILIEGGTLAKPIHEDITCDEVYDSMDNLWNFLFFTGYFRKVRQWMDEETKQIWVALCIPNWEVQYIFHNKISTWFHEYAKAYDRSRLLHAIVSLDVEVFQEELTKALWNTISFYDRQESFYHGFLAGMLAGMEDYVVKSNRESGNGRSDLSIKPMYHFREAFVLEFKVAEENRQLSKKADEALDQIEQKGYAKEVEEDGYEKAHCYGIAFCGKRCLVKLKKG